MEPNRFEKQFRDKLNSRKIQPSDGAWERLEAKLSVAERKKTKRFFSLLSIAASILVFVTIGLFLFNDESKVINVPDTIVGTETKKGTEIPNSKFQIPDVEKQQQNEDIVSAEYKLININKSIIKAEVIQDQSNEVVLQKKVENKEIDFSLIEISKSDEQLINSLDKIAFKEKDNSLPVNVNARGLLAEVESELDLTFRERAYNKVVKNYKKVKEVLANINNH